MTKQSMSSFHEMVSYLENDHITALREIRRLAIGTQKITRQLCGVACNYARRLYTDDRRRTEFYAEAFPGGWQRFHPSKLLLHVLMYFYGVTDSHSVGYGTASAHSVALRGIYDNRSISNDDLMRHIESSGIFVGLQYEDVAVGGEEEPSEQEGDGRARKSILQRQAKPASIFSNQDEDEIGAGDEEADQENDTFEGADNLVRLPPRKPRKPGPSLPRLQWNYVKLCILGRPKRPEDREAILGSLRDGKSVWVKLTPGTSMEYELHKGDGEFTDLPITDFKIENE